MSEFLSHICNNHPEFCILNPSIQICSGEYFSFLFPEKAQYTIEDIAHALSQMCRFNGHCNSFYSVAQHSVMVAEEVWKIAPEHYHQALLHDSSEAFLGDISSPLKKMLPDYKLIEKHVEDAIFNKFNMPLIMDKCIKDADLRLLATEKRDMMADKYDLEWEILHNIIPLQQNIKPLNSKNAKRLFLNSWYNKPRKLKIY
jgi:hypothetical protein